MTNHIENYFSNIILSSKNIDYNKIEKLAYQLSNLRKKKWKTFYYRCRRKCGKCITCSK